MEAAVKDPAGRVWVTTEPSLPKHRVLYREERNVLNVPDPGLCPHFGRFLVHLSCFGDKKLRLKVVTITCALHLVIFQSTVTSESQKLSGRTDQVTLLCRVPENSHDYGTAPAHGGAWRGTAFPGCL